jgi:hypothetical protein
VPTIHDAAPDHDETLIVRLAAEDLHGREAEAARARVAECSACAELLEDIRAITAATAALPGPRRSRDFRLTGADVARLRPVGWRRVLGLFNQPTLAFTRPLATGLATLGIVGLLVTVLPGGFGAGGAAMFSATGGTVAESGGAVGAPAPLAPEASAARGAAPSAVTAASPSQVPGPAAANPASSPATTAGPAGAQNVASPPAGSPAAALPASSGLAPDIAARKGLVDAAPSGGALPGTTAPAPLVVLAPAAVTPSAPSNTGPSPLAILSIGLLAVGLGLAGLHLAARRLV